MSKQGSYSVNQGSNFRKRDSSFKSFLCAMLVFLVICIVIFLVLKFTTESHKPSPKKDVEVIDPNYSKHNAKPNEKIVIINVPETTSSNTPHREPSVTTFPSEDGTTEFSHELFPDNSNEIPDVTTEDSHKLYPDDSTEIPDVTTEHLHDFSDDTSEIPSDYSEMRTHDDTSIEELQTTLRTDDENKNINILIENNTDISTTETTDEEMNEEGAMYEFGSSTVSSEDQNFSEGTDSNDFTTEDAYGYTYSYITNDDVNETSNAFEYIEDTTTEEADIFTTQSNEDFSSRMSSYNDTTNGVATFPQNYEDTTELNINDITSEYVTDLYIDSRTSSDDTYDGITTERSVTYGDITFSDRTDGAEEEEMWTTEDSYSTWYILNRASEQKYFEQEETTDSGFEGYTTDSISPYSNESLYQNYSSSAEEVTESRNSEYDYESTTEDDFVYYESTTQSSDSFISKSSNFTFGMGDPICDSAQCKLVDSEMLGSMNHIAIPCDDFYEFSCGNWKESKEELNYDLIRKISNASYSSDTYLGKFREFHHSCIKHEDHFNYTDRIEKLKKLSSDIGSFELDSSIDDNKLVDIFSKLTLLQSNIFFDIGLTIDEETSAYRLQMTLPSGSTLKNTLKGWSYYEEAQDLCIEEAKSGIDDEVISFDSLSRLFNTYENYQSCLLKYTWHKFADSVQNVLEEMNIFSANHSGQYEEIRGTINKLISLTVMNQIPPPSEIRKVITRREYIELDVSNLQNMYPLFEWHLFFDNIMGRNISNNAKVEVYFADYFKDLMGGMLDEQFTKRNIYNAVLAIIIHNLYQNTVIPRERSNRVAYCLQMSQELMPDISSSLLKSALKESDMITKRLFAKNIYEKLNETLAKALATEDWLDQGSRDTLLAKLHKLKPIFNTNYEYINSRDENRLNKRYINLDVTENEFQTNLITIMQGYRRRIYDLERKVANSDDFFDYFVESSSKHPISFYESDSIIIPDGFLLSILSDVPSYVELARCGFHLAKALLKHFDPTSIQVSLKMSPQLFMETYNQLKTNTYLPNEESIQDTYKFDGSLSVIDRITDNAALKLVVNTMDLKINADLLPWISNSYSREKIFYISIAQEFCKEQSVYDFMLQVYESEKLPGNLRVEGIMFNSDEFARSFACPPGSGLYNELNKVIFPYLQRSDYDYDDNNYEYGQTQAFNYNN